MTGKHRLPRQLLSPARYAVLAQTRGTLAHCPAPPGFSDMCITAIYPIHPKDRESHPLTTKNWESHPPAISLTRTLHHCRARSYKADDTAIKLPIFWLKSHPTCHASSVPLAKAKPGRKRACASACPSPPPQEWLPGPWGFWGQFSSQGMGLRCPLCIKHSQPLLGRDVPTGAGGPGEEPVCGAERSSRSGASRPSGSASSSHLGDKGFLLQLFPI